MSREVRRVPPDWRHPVFEGRLRPMYDEEHATAEARWLEERAMWATGAHPCHEPGLTFEAHHPPPDPRRYRPWTTEDATWWQVWETVSEGTPITPPFPTKDALIVHLARYGDNRGGDWSLETARAFVEGDGWLPTAVIVDGRVLTDAEILHVSDDEKAT